jgi:hypothetical protein
MAEQDDWRDEAYYKALADAHLSGSQDHDRAILTLSSGTLALSATFVHDIAPNPVGCSVALLIAAWVGLIAAIIAIVLSYQTSQAAHRAAMREEDGSTKTRATVTVALTVIGDIGFIAGIVLFAAFAAVNL